MTSNITTSFNQEDILNTRKVIKQISSELINAQLLNRANLKKKQRNCSPLDYAKRPKSRNKKKNNKSKEIKRNQRKITEMNHGTSLTTIAGKNDGKNTKLSYAFSHFFLDSTILNIRNSVDEINNINSNNNSNYDFTFDKVNSNKNSNKMKKYRNMSQRNIQSRQIALDNSNEGLLTYTTNGTRKMPLYRSFMMPKAHSNSRSKYMQENTDISYKNRSKDKNAILSNSQSNTMTLDGLRLNNNINTSKGPHIFHKKIIAIDYYTHVGYSGPKIIKENQDFYTIESNFLKHYEQNESYYIAVFDGHGKYGHLASRHVAGVLASDLKCYLNQSNTFNDPFERDNAITNVFLSTNKSLINSTISTSQSGSTCCALIITPTSIITSNVGDSRAIVGRFANGKWISIELTRDQKPDNPREKRRIIERGGRVGQIIDNSTGKPGGPMRIWKGNEDVPGLAMARSFGDTLAAECGAISEPEIKEYKLSAYDKFVIVASDGIWEFISNDQCVMMMSQYYLNNDLKGGLEYLYSEANKRWNEDYSESIDDITAVMAFFD